MEQDPFHGCHSPDPPKPDVDPEYVPPDHDDDDAPADPPEPYRHPDEDPPEHQPPQHVPPSPHARGGGPMIACRRA